LEHDVDMLWIGARSTVSPFIMQEIADALEATEKPVLIKNPVNPDLALWLGGIERIYSSGVKNIGAIHRGFSTYEKTKYRNNPEWQLAIEFQNKFPDIPLINDPSHITGNRNMIFDVSQTALDLNFDGLMIETHFDPDNAWSDAAQQVTPKVLIQIMKDLKIRKETDPEADYNKKLDVLRAQRDVIDNQTIEVLGKRTQAADGMCELKEQKSVAVLECNRWSGMLGRMVLEGQEHGLSEEFILKMFKAIHQESIN